MQQALARGRDLHSAGHFAEAEAIYRQILAADPTNAPALHLLGVLANQLGHAEASAALISQAIQIEPLAASYHSNLGVAYQSLGRREEALACYTRALDLKPDHVDALNNQAVLLQSLGQPEAALASFERSLKLRPNHAETLTNAAISLRVLGRLAEAESRLRRALKLQPTHLEALTNLASTLQVAGRLDEAAALYRRTLEIAPDSAVAHSGLIFLLDLLPDGAAEAQAERQRWNARFGQGWRANPPAYGNTAEPERRLRVGYVSADFYRHSAALAILPILRAHVRAQVEVVCYSGVIIPDALTAEIRSLADGWRDVAQLPDERLAAQIQADAIDVLVDLSGHSAGNRLPVFGRRPAPVQVSAWGYAAGTGLDAIDAFLADPVVLPTGQRAAFAEAVVDLPSVLCFEPPADAPAVVPLPALAAGHVTFGSFHRLPRLTDDVLDLWARVVAAVPDARMVLKGSGLEEPAVRARIEAAFGRQGVSAGRLTILGPTSRQEHLAAYGLVDLQLDTFPQSGGITTLEGLMMGVPSVTLAGSRITERMSASFLTTLGLPDLIATSREAFVAAAVQAAADVQSLAAVRAALRARLLASPIGDVRQYTRSVEGVYRALWRRWCAAQPS
ncbi:MAG: tetratricopeptide repeat protein [Chloroflexi bacterium]|nr:tetratricopeptide repeat protein [Chloroflexota bacterium]